MSELKPENFRSDRKYPNCIGLRIPLFPISVIFTDFWRFKVGLTMSIRLTKSVWPAFAILISSSIWGEGPISILWRMIDGAKDCSGGTSALVSSLL